jgi:RNA recognition motif-containing protein
VVPSNLYPLKEENAMGSKLFLEGLPPSFSAQQLKDLLAPFGTVLSALVIIDPAGESLRMGKVEMSTPREAERAIQKLHRSHLQGKLLLVFKQVNQGGSTGSEKKGAS